MRDILRIAHRGWRLAAFLGVAMVAGCANLVSQPEGGIDASPLSAPGGFELSGRFSLYQAKLSVSGQIDWRRAGRRDEILLSSPFGQGMAQVVADEHGAELKSSDGQTWVAADGEELLASFLGQPFPLSRLLVWLRADRNAEGIGARDALGRPLHLSNEGWSVDYDYASASPTAIPSRLIVRRGDDFELRLSVQSLTAVAETAP